MAKTKAMCIINRSTKLIAIQHEKKHGKGSKNSSTYFDNRIDIEQESDVLIFKIILCCLRSISVSVSACSVHLVT